MALTAETWPIVAATLPLPGADARGVRAQDAPAETWAASLLEVADAGFDGIDLTDTWLQPGDLGPSRLRELAVAAGDAGVRISAISAVRHSVIDRERGEANLAYSHRTLEAAAELGCSLVSVGLHQPLTEAQQRQLWFWTVEGHRDLPEDAESWDLAATRLRELGRHAAELGLLLSLEMYEDTYLGTADSSVRLVEQIGLPNVGLNPDIGNLVRLHRPVEPWRELVEKTLPYANFWHVKNYFRDEDVATGFYTAVPAPLELGVIDYRAAVRFAVSVGFQGLLSTEHYGGDGLSVCATNRDYLRRHALPKRDGYALGRSRVDQLQHHAM
ncbi:sugar phosphate isomerase/epimerase family protein [Lysobacter korlensis]|uniref:Sugar phosphate isomerase/epimerase family protein n=1 Tax=Lysobacter korlensis TaxID=553636 RepID=A0ABV6RMF9_9GAMM